MAWPARAMSLGAAPRPRRLRGAARPRMLRQKRGPGVELSEDTTMVESTVDGLAIRSTVREMVAAFEVAEREIRSAFAAILAAEARVNGAFGNGPNDQIRVAASSRWDCNFKDADRAIERIARDAWRFLVDRLELRRFMSIARTKELDEQLLRGALPPVTEESVFAFAGFYRENIGAMFDEAVVEVFNWLRHQGGEYKTNKAFEIGSRVVLDSMVKRHWMNKGKFEVTHYREQRLTALENVFSALDGKGMIGKAHQSALRMAIEASTSGRAETDYFEARMFAKGTLHMRFKRLDLLTELNRRAGGMQLRPPKDDT